MKIKFLGAAGVVTGSSYVLTSGSGKSILIDFGMFQGLPEVEQLNYEPVSFDLGSLSATILTHAHLDHSGRLPLLLSHGFKGNIWMTPPTRDLTELALYDEAKVAKENRAGQRVLFDHTLAVQTVLKFETLDYRISKQIGDFTITFRDAGHILGSASIEITDNNPESEIRKVVFSGDLGNSPEDLERATELIDNADAVVMESTYGDRLHPKTNPVDSITSEINAIENSGGTLLVPTFSLDRTQELLHIIMHLKREGKVRNETPVYLDSPMAERATQVYVEYPKDFNQEIQDDLKRGDIFNFPGLVTIERPTDSQALHRETGPKVIIAGSGMMTGGRVRPHAVYYLPMETTRLLIVGYQAEGTLGRQILEGNKNVNIDGFNVSIKASVNDTQAMSSHADQGQLINWLKHINGVKKVFLIHGEDGPRGILSQKISEELGTKNIFLPKMNEEVTL
jgi:metallo-beta-lactamase family protein